MTVPSLEELLDRMADALQRGALADLSDLIPAIEASMAALPRLDANRAEGLRRRAARNAHCLESAARGVRAALARIRKIGGTELSTYGRDGRMIVSTASAATPCARL